MGSRKVGIVGAGFVGATAAYSLAMLGTCHEVVLYDINTDVAKGKAIDIGQATAYSPQGTIVSAAETAADLASILLILSSLSMSFPSSFCTSSLILFRLLNNSLNLA